MKRIAIFCDGTWNGADQARGGEPCPTNVVKLSLRVAPRANDARQIVYYGEGVGTGNWLDRLAGGITGAGLVDNLLDAYRFLMHNYEPGDALYFFGFSRGAFTARSLVGMIRKCGLLKRSSAAKYLEAVRLYGDESHPDDPGPTAFRTAHSVLGNEPIPIEFIGVWDTVGSLGIPVQALSWITARKHRFHDVRLSGTVRRAYQALAINEQRGPFEAVRWAYAPKPNQVVEQVWFAGVHSDVGGGYARGESPADGWGLSDITLEWMSEKAAEAGLVLDPPVFPLQPDPLARAHDSMRLLYAPLKIERAIGLAATDREQPTSESTDPDPTQSVHPSVLARWDAMPDYRPENLREYFARIGDPRGYAGGRSANTWKGQRA